MWQGENEREREMATDWRRNNMTQERGRDDRTFVGGAVVDAAGGRDVHEVRQRAAAALIRGGRQPSDDSVYGGFHQAQAQEAQEAHHRSIFFQRPIRVGGIAC